MTYHPNGAIKGFHYGNGITHALTQNARQLPLQSKDAFGASTTYLDDTYEYDGNGNVTKISDGISTSVGTRTMTYDNLDRLASMSAPMMPGFSGSIYYGYDGLDNLVSVSAPGRSQRYCYDASNRLTFLRAGATVACPTGAAMVAFGYDVQGNVAFKNNVFYTFDLGNRLRSTSGGVSSTYVYDALGRRVRDVTTASKYSLYTQNGQLAFASDARAGKGFNYVYLGGSLVATRSFPTGTSTYTVEYQHTDALGTPVAVTNANRGVTRSYYEPYGKVLNRAVQDGPGFTGHVEDAATGLTYMQQRYYDPGVGRFLSVDPVGVDAASGSNFSRYWYGNNNPFKYTDPDGRLGDLCKSGGGGGCDSRYVASDASNGRREPFPMFIEVNPVPRVAAHFGIDKQNVSFNADEYNECAQSSCSVELNAHSDTAFLMHTQTGMPPLPTIKGMKALGGKALGRGFPTKANRVGNPQPYNPANGQFLPSAANPGLSLSPMRRFSAGFMEGLAEAKGGAPGVPIGRAGGVGYMLGFVIGNL